MLSYLRGLRRYQRDVRLYWSYTLFSNVAIGVFMLVFNLYLLELDLREDFIGLFSFIQTASMALTAFLMGRLIGRFGGPGRDAAELRTPWGVAVFADRTIWIADTGNRRLVELAW